MIWRLIKDLKLKLHDTKDKKAKPITWKLIIYNHVKKNIKCLRLHPWYSIKIQSPNNKDNKVLGSLEIHLLVTEAFATASFFFSFLFYALSTFKKTHK